MIKITLTDGTEIIYRPEDKMNISHRNLIAILLDSSNFEEHKTLKSNKEFMPIQQKLDTIKITYAELVETLFYHTAIKHKVREVYQMVRDIRESGLPVVGDRGGIWVAKSRQELLDFAEKLRNKAKSDIASVYYLTGLMAQNLGENLTMKW